MIIILQGPQFVTYSADKTSPPSQVGANRLPRKGCSVSAAARFMASHSALSVVISSSLIDPVKIYNLACRCIHDAREGRAWGASKMTGLDWTKKRKRGETLRIEEF